jgi:hypothetical protein
MIRILSKTDIGSFDTDQYIRVAGGASRLRSVRSGEGILVHEGVISDHSPEYTHDE